METYDHYREAREIAAYLATEGLTAEADSLREAIDQGMSGTRIFMALRFHLRPLVDRDEIDEPHRRRIEVLLGKIDAALAA